jgi:hypothetical protein
MRTWWPDTAAGFARDPENELYDAACERLAAAPRLAQSSRRGGHDAAVPATLGAVEAALGDAPQ